MRISDWSSDVCSSDLCGLDQHRIADVLREAFGLLAERHRTRRARNDGQAELDRGALRLDLVAHRADMLGLGPDEDHVVRFDDFGETLVFGEERSEEHTSELQSLMRISYAVFCLKTKKDTR